MTVIESINNAAANGDIKGIRIMMKNSMLVDPSFTELLEMEALTENIDGLYDAHDGRAFQTDKASWNDDYMNKLMVQVVGNFSHERVAHLKEVVRHLRPNYQNLQSSSSSSLKHKEAFDVKEQAARMSYEEQKSQDERNNRIVYNRNAKIATGAVAGGVVGGAAAVVVGGSFVVGAIIGSVAVGTVVAITTNGGQ